MLALYLSPDVRVRGVRSHDQRARGALSASEGEPSVLAGAAQVLRQAPLQVHQLDVRQQPVGLRVADARSQLSCARGREEKEEEDVTHGIARQSRLLGHWLRADIIEWIFFNAPTRCRSAGTETLRAGDCV